VGAAALAVARTFSIPIAEVSGLAIRHLPDRLELLAIGDATAELARATLTDGVPQRWTITRVDSVKDRKGSQLEAVTADVDGRIVVLRERPRTQRAARPGRSCSYAAPSLAQNALASIVRD
jgi:hypothetical protein